MSDDSSEQELISAIEANPYDSNVYAVYGDWLSDRGDPRGELIALQLAAERDPSKAPDAAAVFQQHRATFLGDLEGYTLLDPSAFTWRYGFIHRARLFHFFDDAFDALSQHPSARFVVELAVGNAPDARRLARFLEVFVARAPRTLHALALGEDRGDTRFVDAALGDLWPHLPHLRRLVIDGGRYRIGTIELPDLEHLTIRTGGLAATNLDALAKARLPELRVLELGGEDIRRHATEYPPPPENLAELAFDELVTANVFPALRHLAVNHCRFTAQVLRALGDARILTQLESLDLAFGSLGREGAHLLRVYEPQLRHLGMLDLSHNGLRDLRNLRSLAHRVVLEPQS